MGASLGGRPSYGAIGGARRRPVLEDEDAEEGVLGSPEMGERLAGVPVAVPQASLAGMGGVGAGAGGLYGSVNNGQGAFCDSDNPSTSSGHMMSGPESGEGLVGDTADRAAQAGEQDSLTDPAYSSHADLVALASRELPALHTTQFPARLTHTDSLTGIEPTEWIGGRQSVCIDAGSQDPFDDSTAVIISSPEMPTSSSISQDDLERRGSISSDGPGSSAHGNYNSAVLACGQQHPSSSTSHLGHDGRRSPGPSSLLPTQTQSGVPTAYRSILDDDDESERGSRRRRGFLSRPLKWRLRGGRPSDATCTTGAMPSINASLGSAPESRSSFSIPSVPHSPRPPSASFAAASAVAMSPDVGARLRNGSLPTTRPGSLVRPQSPTLESLPPSPFSNLPSGSIQEMLPASVREGLFGPLAIPSPSVSEGSVAAPEGLLHPHLTLSRPGMQSTGQFSFRDEMDYSRPISGVSLSFIFLLVTYLYTDHGMLQMVNNRHPSQTTIPTVYTRESEDAPPVTRTSYELEREWEPVSTLSSPIQENTDAES